MYWARRDRIFTIDAKQVSDIKDNTEKIKALHSAMIKASTPVKATMLGAIGENNILSRLSDDYSIVRKWYKKTDSLLKGVPFVFEILIAETDGGGGFYHGVNHSPTFADFLSDSHIMADELWATGIEGALVQAGCNFDHHIAVVHLVCPVLEFMDRGKTRLNLSDAMLKPISTCIWKASSTLFKEKKRAEKDAAKVVRQYQERIKKQKPKNTSLKDAVFSVMEEAVDIATNQKTLPANVRNLYYKVRALIQEYTDKELDYTYFSQNLLIQYWQQYGRHPLIYNDPRGVLYEPHGETVLQLGTFQVRDYHFPEYQYNKILYIEKKGLWPTIEASNMHKKYDMAFIAAEGYATESARILLAGAQQNNNYTIFVLHDADPDGYNIARTLQEETARMPNHNIEVIDLGLHVADAEEMELEPEKFIRKKALPREVIFSGKELEYFKGEPKRFNHDGVTTQWECRRIELNAMSAGQLIDYIEKGIQKSGSITKVIPPSDYLEKKIADQFKDEVSRNVYRYIANLIDTDKITENLIGHYMNELGKKGIDVSAYLERHNIKTWVSAVNDHVANHMNEIRTDINGKIKRNVNEQIRRL